MGWSVKGIRKEGKVEGVEGKVEGRFVRTLGFGVVGGGCGMVVDQCMGRECWMEGWVNNRCVEKIMWNGGRLRRRVWKRVMTG